MSMWTLSTTTRAVCPRLTPTAAPYSVAQHSVMVAELLPADHRLRAYGLLHDAHEAWTGDISSPMKRMLAMEMHIRIDHRQPLSVGHRPLAAIAERLDEAIRDACGLERPRFVDDEAVKAADDLAAWVEARDLLHPIIAADYHRIMPRPAGTLPGLIKAWPWPEAEERFLAAAARYLPHCPE